MPKLIHTMYGLWDDAEPGLAERFILGGWIRRNPAWAVVLWRKPHLESLLNQEYPEYLATYGSFERGAQKADFLRYLLVYHFGGAYCDLDLYCRASLENFQLAQEAVFHTETMLTPEEMVDNGRRHHIRRGVPEKRQRIANYFFAATPRHPVLRDLLALVERRASETPKEDYDVIYTTGPDAMTEAVLSSECPAIRILSVEEAHQTAVHLCRGSWRENKDT